MTNPWNVPPLPSKGDDSIDSTYAGVGRVLSSWEEVELTLSFIYAVFVGRPSDTEACREYGAGAIFDLRMTNMEAAAFRYFCIKPDQGHEGQFLELSRRARGFSSRRNEVAHGIVLVFHWIMTIQGTVPPTAVSDVATSMQSFLIPPNYTKKKFDEKNKPLFAYSSVELREFERLLSQLNLDLVLFQKSLRR